jgi:hypothetical protein
MANLPIIASLVLGLGALFTAARPGFEVSSAECTATSFAQIASVVASCTTSTIGDITVPAGGQIVLNGLQGKTVRQYPLQGGFLTTPY